MDKRCFPHSRVPTSADRNSAQSCPMTNFTTLLSLDRFDAVIFDMDGVVTDSTTGPRKMLEARLRRLSPSPLSGHSGEDTPTLS